MKKEKQKTWQEELVVNLVLSDRPPEIKKDKEGNFTSFIIDQELDKIECSFHGDNGVELNTENWSYLSLSIENLDQLLNLAYEAQEKIEEHWKIENEKENL